MKTSKILMWLPMFLLFEGFQPQNVPTLLFSMKHSYLLMATVTSVVNNSF